MVGRSDIEFDGEDSNLSMDLEDSNLSEPTSRQLRTRKSRQDPEPVEEEKKVTRSARLGIKNKRLMDKEREEFLNQFDQNKSERERRKKDTKQTYATGGRSRQKAKIYDEKGILVTCQKDLCDCMDDTCPGCHFPCPKCRSNKCGHECRQNRKWIFDCVELDGIPGSMKENPYAKEFQTATSKK